LGRQGKLFNQRTRGLSKKTKKKGKGRRRRDGSEIVLWKK